MAKTLAEKEEAKAEKLKSKEALKADKALAKEEEEEAEPNLEKAPDAKVDKSRVQVYNKSGNYVRTYTEELHGKKALGYAEEYAKKIGGSVRFPILLK